MKPELSRLSSQIKLFSDGADEKTLYEMNETPWIAGMTTNPSLMRKAGVTDYRGFAKKVLEKIREKPISFEVFADDLAGMKTQADEIKTWGKNVYVKIPVVNSEGKSTQPIIRELSQAGVKLNITALFTFEQVLETCQSLKGGAPSLVSIFAGRLADSGIDPLPLATASAAACEWAGPDVELLWASTREVYNIQQAIDTGCKVITAPADVLKKLAGLGKTPMDLCLDTVRTFKSDSIASGFAL